MYKHLFVPYETSYRVGAETVESYKCKFCNKVLSKYNDFEKLDKKFAECDSHMSSTTIVEKISQETNCLVHDKSLVYHIFFIEYKIGKSFKNFKKLLKKMIFKSSTILLWIRSLF
jgi:phage FluMu protein Com